MNLNKLEETGTTCILLESSSYRDTMTPGQGYEFFEGHRTSRPIRHMQYRGGNSFAFLDDAGRTYTPDEARLHANPDGSVRFQQGGKFTFNGRVYGTEKLIKTEITFVDFGNDMAVIDVATSECVPNGSQKGSKRIY